MKMFIFLLKIKYSFPVTRHIRKIYELILQIITRLKTGMEFDPSYLICQCLTVNQIKSLEIFRNVPKNLILELDNIRNIKLSIVILFRDKIELTTTCLNSILGQSLVGIELQVILIDNGSSDINIGEKIASRFFKNERIQWILRRIDESFNFSRLNNLAVKESEIFNPKYYLFLNNDVICNDHKTLLKVVEFRESMGESVGAVGCTLLYPTSKIQHLFLAPGIKIVAGHPLKGLTYRSDMMWFQSPRPVPAVTGAFLFLSKSQFDEVGGFDETLAFAYQDLDICLKIQRVNPLYSNWTLSQLVCIHHENATRERAHSWNEVAKIYARWKKELSQNRDFSSCFSKESEMPVLKLFSFCRMRLAKKDGKSLKTNILS